MWFTHYSVDLPCSFVVEGEGAPGPVQPVAQRAEAQAELVPKSRDDSHPGADAELLDASAYLALAAEGDVVGEPLVGHVDGPLVGEDLCSR